jgi:hypothetical protein
MTVSMSSCMKAEVLRCTVMTGRADETFVSHLSIFLLKCSLPLLMESTSLSGLYRRRLLYFWWSIFLWQGAGDCMQSATASVSYASSLDRI